MATSRAGFLLPMETASYRAHPCSDSANPPSGASWLSYQWGSLFGKYLQEAALQGGQWAKVDGGDPHHGEGAWQGQDGVAEHGCVVSAACGATKTPPSPSCVGDTWPCSPGLQHPHLCYQQKTFKTSVRATHPGGDDHLVTGSMTGAGEMCFYHRKKAESFYCRERGGMEDGEPCFMPGSPSAEKPQAIAGRQCLCM